MPKISIVLPTYNGEKYLSESIESVINQTEDDWELIIVNDCSTDDTSRIAQSYEQKDARIKVIINETNKKLPASLNIGFKVAAGKYFTWTSDDNMYKPDALKHMAEVLDNNQTVDLVTCDMDWIDENGSFLYHHSKCTDRKNGALALAYICNIGACFMYRASLLNKVGEYNRDYFRAEDYDYWCRIALKGSIYYDPSNLYTYRKQPKSLSSTSFEKCRLMEQSVRIKYAICLVEKYAFNKKIRKHALYSLCKREEDNLIVLKEYFKKSPNKYKFYLCYFGFLMLIRI